MFNGEKFVAIGGVGNHELDRYVLNEVEGISRIKIPFIHLNMDTYPNLLPQLGKMQKNLHSISQFLLQIFTIFDTNVRGEPRLTMTMTDNGTTQKQITYYVQPVRLDLANKVC